MLSRVGDPWAAGVRAELVAMASGVVLLADETSLHIGAFGDGRPARRLTELARPVGGISVSPSGRYGLLRSPEHNWVAVVDLTEGAYLASFGAPDTRPRNAVAAFGTLDGHDVLFLRRVPYTLEVLSLPDGEVLASARYTAGMPFRFRSLHPVNEEFVVAIGAGESEGNLSMLTVSVPELLSDPAAAGTEFLRRSRPFDYVFALSAGPCGAGAVAVHRDPLNDGDEPDDDPDPDEPNADIDGLHGFYVRRLRDNALVDRIPYSGTVPTESPMFGTDAAIVVGLDGRVAAYPRSSTGLPPAPVEIDAPVYGFDVAANGVVVARPDGTVDVFRVERAIDGESDDGPIGERRPRAAAETGRDDEAQAGG